MVPSDISPRTDAELLAAHVAGDRDAFALLFARHRRRLTRLAAVQSNSPEDAADALQDALLAAHRGAANFRQHAAVGSWLYRIVANACVDRRRYNALRPTVCLDETLHPVADRTVEIDTVLLVRDALAGLPAPQCDAVVAVDMHGLSVRAAAELLGVPEGTVKSRRARARTHLLRTLTGH